MGVVFWIVIIAGICGIVLLATSCGISAALDDRGYLDQLGMTNNKEKIMPERNSLLFQAWNVKKSDFWTKAPVPRIIDAAVELRDLWTAGYATYDIIANGGLSYLHTVATGTAKIVALYQSIKPKFLYPDSLTLYSGNYIDATHIHLMYLEGGDLHPIEELYTADDYFTGMCINCYLDDVGSPGSPEWIRNTIIDYDGTTGIATVAVSWPYEWNDIDSLCEVGIPDLIEDGDVGVDATVEILGVKLGINNLIESICFPVQVEINYTTSAKWKYGNWHFKNPIDGGRFPYVYDSIINCDIGAFAQDSEGGHLENCIVNVYDDYVGTFDTTIINSLFVSKGTGFLVIYNAEPCNQLRIHFKGFNKSTGQVEFYPTDGYDQINDYYFFEDCSVLFENYNNFSFEYLYTRNSIISGAGLQNAIFLPVPASFDTTISNNILWDELDLDEIMNSANYTLFSAQFNPQRKTVRGVAGTINRKYYRVQFMANVIVDDGLKHFDFYDYLVIHRTEEETALLGLSIKDLTLYDGASVYAYRNDSSFLIIGQNAGDASDLTVFAWHKGEIAPTVFGDAPFGVEFEIIWCFQIWQAPDEIEVRNYGDWDDSELEGTAVYQDVTSKVVIQN
jgi:hypothetical protein